MKHPWEELEQAVRQERSEEAWAIIEQLRQQKVRSKLRSRRLKFAAFCAFVLGAPIATMLTPRGTITPVTVRKPAPHMTIDAGYAYFAGYKHFTIVDAGTTAVRRGYIAGEIPGGVAVTVPVGQSSDCFCACITDDPRCVCIANRTAGGLLMVVTYPDGQPARYFCNRP